ncbi:hypothetical protein CPB84DRAFT_1778472 [Gymnopilus junonius]|uniref:Uncharacterized protein n=1 Tax=Gymnopilus junonius TaxID=109634 RepID=A0A9P5TNY8_GYMJU|nr:hypothetical protein CPB84DRAFT_1778472 [Gymnopilus junonius]
MCKSHIIARNERPRSILHPVLRFLRDHRNRHWEKLFGVFNKDEDEDVPLSRDSYLARGQLEDAQLYVRNTPSVQVPFSFWDWEEPREGSFTEYSSEDEQLPSGTPLEQEQPRNNQLYEQHTHFEIPDSLVLELPCIVTLMPNPAHPDSYETIIFTCDGRAYRCILPGEPSQQEIDDFFSHQGAADHQDIDHQQRLFISGQTLRTHYFSSSAYSSSSSSAASDEKEPISPFVIFPSLNKPTSAPSTVPFSGQWHPCINVDDTLPTLAEPEGGNSSTPTREPLLKEEFTIPTERNHPVKVKFKEEDITLIFDLECIDSDRESTFDIMEVDNEELPMPGGWVNSKITGKKRGHEEIEEGEDNIEMEDERPVRRMRFSSVPTTVYL